MASSGELCSPEEVSINSYAVFMGYLSMAIKGLGFLVLTWTTVVLLGGFVSMLHKKDFWCLTFITLVQTAGIFDVSMNEKLAYMKNAQVGLSLAILSAALNSEDGQVPASFSHRVCLVLSAFLLVMVQLVLFAVILAPLAIIYVLGIFMSGVISLWRLIEHDYGGNSDGEASNLAPAMDTLYYLALLQGVLFCYRFVLACLEKKMSYCVDRSEAREVLYSYVRETRRGCEKDPSFVQGRNLTTYAVDKIGSNSAADRIYGVKILYEAIRLVKHSSSDDVVPVQRMLMKHHSWDDVATGQRMLMKHLVLCASSSRHVLQQLLEMLDSSGLNNRENRSQAAVIVKQLAPYIDLEQFPRGIQHISSLIGTFEQFSTAEPYHNNEHDQRPSPAGELWEAYNYKKLFLQGLSILRDLAAEENNFRVMSETRDLVSKIMAPVTSDLLDHTTDDHGPWCEVVDRSMEVLSQLTGAQGETGAKVRREISSCAEAINTLWRILSCKKCKEELRQRAIWILTRLYTDTIGISSSTYTDLRTNKSGFCGKDFVRMLVDIFTHGNEYRNSIRGYAGEALSEICFLGRITDATIVMQTSGDVVDSLTEVLLHEEENEACRQAAAEILEHLCTYYTKDDEYSRKLKIATLKVFGKLLCSGEDLESQCNGTQENNEQDKKDEGFQVDALSDMSPNLLVSLLSLCGIVYDTALITDLLPQLDASRFLNKLKEIVEKKSDPSVENLSLCRATGKMIISMLKCCSGGFFKQGDFGSLIEALSSASKNMLDLDYSVVCSSASCSKNISKLDRPTLASLVGEAKELHAKAPSTSEWLICI